MCFVTFKVKFSCVGSYVNHTLCRKQLVSWHILIVTYIWYCQYFKNSVKYAWVLSRILFYRSVLYILFSLKNKTTLIHQEFLFVGLFCLKFYLIGKKNICWMLQIFWNCVSIDFGYCFILVLLVSFLSPFHSISCTECVHG